jgi:TonB family C-terminal domain
MSEKQSPKVNLGSRSINFFLIGCIIGLTISLLALDIWGSVRSKNNAAIAVEEEAALDDIEMPNTDQDNTPPPPEPEQEPEKEEVVEQVLKETQKEVETAFDFTMEADDETAIEADDEEVSENTDYIPEDEPIIKTPQVRAKFKGGNEELRKYLAENCQYPKAARDAGWQGVVIVEFVVEKDGSIGQTSVIKSVCSSLDEEACRVVKAMPKWEPGENNGQRCRSFFQLPITFTLQ